MNRPERVRLYMDGRTGYTVVVSVDVFVSGSSVSGRCSAAGQTEAEVPFRGRGGLLEGAR